MAAVADMLQGVVQLCGIVVVVTAAAAPRPETLPRVPLHIVITLVRQENLDCREVSKEMKEDG